MKSVLVILSLFVFSFSSAGINVVGKGGGFAEMLTLKMDRQLSSQLTACLTNPTLCKISAETVGVVQVLLQRLPELQRTLLQFTPECKAAPSVTASKIEISSCLLYTQDPSGEVIALPLKNISFLVLAVRAQQAGVNPAGLLNSMKDAFADFKLMDDATVLPYKGKRIILHSILFERNWYEKESSLVLEVPLESHDVTELLAQKLCGTYQIKDLQIRLNRAEMTQGPRPIFDGEVVWECSFPYNRSFKAKLTVSALLNEKLVLIPDSVNILVRQKESL